MMIQEIAPAVYSNQYRFGRAPEGEDLLLVFDEKGFVYARPENDLPFPRFAELTAPVPAAFPLFSIDERVLYLAREGEAALPAGYAKQHFGALMHGAKRPWSFAAVTAGHLAEWYRSNRFCGRCGSAMEPGKKERSLVCPHCGATVYPRINPVVIVCVTDGDRVLLTRYTGRDYTHYALVAGFCEIGERPEDTVRREGMEETGIRVKDIRYWGSQPWGLSSSMLLGFFARLDGDPTVTVDRSELSYAGWFERGELDLKDDGISLTRSMICAFLAGEE
jgi:NAD+ diphosphatase